MKRVILLIFVIVLSFCLSVSAFAFALPANMQTVRDGDTYVGTFKTTLMTPEQKAFMKDWFQFPERAICYVSKTANLLYFELFDDEAPLTYDASDPYGAFIMFGAPVSSRYVVFDLATLNPKGSIVGTASYDASGAVEFGNFIFWAYMTKNCPNFNRYPSDRLLNYVGRLIFEDDGGLEEGGGNDDGGILGWLTSFWDKLKQLFLGLFVPRSGYLDSWFGDIRSAFEAKTGGLSSVFSSVLASFNSLKTAPQNRLVLNFTLPPNWLYSGFPGKTVNLLGSAGDFFAWIRPVFNGVVLLFTFIICYQKLSATVKT